MWPSGVQGCDPVNKGISKWLLQSSRLASSNLPTIFMCDENTSLLCWHISHKHQGITCSHVVVKRSECTGLKWKLTALAYGSTILSVSVRPVFLLLFAWFFAPSPPPKHFYWFSGSFTSCIRSLPRPSMLVPHLWSPPPQKRSKKIKIRNNNQTQVHFVLAVYSWSNSLYPDP